MIDKIKVMLVFKLKPAAADGQASNSHLDDLYDLFVEQALEIERATGEMLALTCQICVQKAEL